MCLPWGTRGRHSSPRKLRPLMACISVQELQIGRMFVYSSPEAEMATEQTIEERIRRMTPVTAPPDQHEAVAALSSLLEKVAHARRRGKCQLVGPDGQAIPIPESAFYLFERVAEVLARGDAIT